MVAEAFSSVASSSRGSSALAVIPIEKYTTSRKLRRISFFYRAAAAACCSTSQRAAAIHNVLQSLLKHTSKSLRDGIGNESVVEGRVDVAVHFGDGEELPRGGFDEWYHRSGDKCVGNRRVVLHEAEPGGFDAGLAVKTNVLSAC